MVRLSRVRYGMEEQKEKKHEPALPERPLECCGECRRPIQVIYTEIIGKTISRFAMCDECPVLHRKLHGSSSATAVPGKAPASLACGRCGLTLDEVKMGAPLGCPLCYEIFSDEVVHELAQLERLPPKFVVQRKGSLCMQDGRQESSKR